MRWLLCLIDPPGHLTRFGSWRLAREARKAGFEVMRGHAIRGHWYLSARHKTITHWGFTILSRAEWERTIRPRLEKS